MKCHQTGKPCNRLPTNHPFFRCFCCLLVAGRVRVETSKSYTNLKSGPNLSCKTYGTFRGYMLKVSGGSGIVDWKVMRRKSHWAAAQRNNAAFWKHSSKSSPEGHENNWRLDTFPWNIGCLIMGFLCHGTGIIIGFYGTILYLPEY